MISRKIYKFVMMQKAQKVNKQWHQLSKKSCKSTNDTKSVKLTFQAALRDEDDFTFLQYSTSLDCHFQKV